MYSARRPMSKSPHLRTPLRPAHTEAASARAWWLACAIARTRKRLGPQSTHEPALRRSAGLLRRMRRAEDAAQTEARHRRVAWETALARAESVLKKAKGR
jgi:hypothetical protein